MITDSKYSTIIS